MTVYSRYVDSKKQVLIYMHIPKAGGSSMQKMLKFSGWSLEIDRELLKASSDSGHHHTWNELRKFYSSNELSELESFTIVRHPMSRFESEMRHRGLVSKNQLESFLFSMNSAVLRRKPFFDNHLIEQVNFIGRDTRVYYYEDGYKSIVDDLVNRQILSKDTPEFHEKNKVTQLRYDWKRAPEIFINHIRSLYSIDFDRLGYGEFPDSPITQHQR